MAAVQRVSTQPQEAFSGSHFGGVYTHPVPAPRGLQWVPFWGCLYSPSPSPKRPSVGPTPGVFILILTQSQPQEAFSGSHSGGVDCLAVQAVQQNAGQVEQLGEGREPEVDHHSSQAHHLGRRGGGAINKAAFHHSQTYCLAVNCTSTVQRMCCSRQLVIRNYCNQNPAYVQILLQLAKCSMPVFGIID